MRLATAVLVPLAGCWPGGAFQIGRGFDNRKHPGVDQCREAPEDYDGFRDSDGCPDPDNDDDGIPDRDDVCPDVAGSLASPASRGC